MSQEDKGNTDLTVASKIPALKKEVRYKYQAHCTTDTDNHSRISACHYTEEVIRELGWIKIEESKRETFN